MLLNLVRFAVRHHSGVPADLEHHHQLWCECRSRRVERPVADLPRHLWMRGFSESPTISYSLPESREFFGRMQAPLSANQLAVLGNIRRGRVLQDGGQNDEWLAELEYLYRMGGSASRLLLMSLKKQLLLIEGLERAGLISFAIQIVPFAVSSPSGRDQQQSGRYQRVRRSAWSSIRTKTASGLPTCSKKCRTFVLAPLPWIHPRHCVCTYVAGSQPGAIYFSDPRCRCRSH